MLTGLVDFCSTGVLLQHSLRLQPCYWRVKVLKVKACNASKRLAGALEKLAQSSTHARQAPDSLFVCAQHIVGTISWSSGYRTMYFQVPFHFTTVQCI